MIGEDLGAALVATPEAAAERLGAAGLDVGDGAPMRRRHRRAMGRQIFAREAAKDVRDLDHGGSAASEAGHQFVEDASERDAGGFGEVGVDGGRGDVDVAEQDLHDPGVDAVFEQPRRIAVAQGVRRDPPRDARLAGGLWKVRRSTCWLAGWSPERLGKSQRGLRWVFQSLRRSSRTGCGNGMNRSLSPLPMMRSRRLAPSMAPISKVAASLMRKPQEYMSARQAL